MLKTFKIIFVCIKFVIFDTYTDFSLVIEKAFATFASSFCRGFKPHLGYFIKHFYAALIAKF